MSRIIVVLGYGCHLTEGMKRYLAAVASCARVQHPDRVFLTGGATNKKSAPHLTESGMMYAMLCRDVSADHMVCDRTARTTQEDLVALRDYLAERPQHRTAQLIIFCDRARALKVRLLCRMIVGVWPELRTVPLTTGVRAWFVQTFIVTPLDILAWFVPPLARVKLGVRLRVIERS